jgi:hypothetical protein
MATATSASSTSSPAPSSGQGADDNYAIQSAADGGDDPQGRRQPGEPLCPERVPLEVLQRIRTRLGSYWWNALYQQRPSPAEGLLFLKDWIQPPLPVAPG